MTVCETYIRPVVGRVPVGPARPACAYPPQHAAAQLAGTWSARVDARVQEAGAARGAVGGTAGSPRHGPSRSAAHQRGSHRGSQRQRKGPAPAPSRNVKSAVNPGIRGTWPD